MNKKFQKRKNTNQKSSLEGEKVGAGMTPASHSPDRGVDACEGPIAGRTWAYVEPALHVGLIWVLCFVLGLFPIESEDIFSNIVTGAYLWREKSIPDVDPFSFTGPHRWVLNRPLPSLIFFSVYSYGGFPAIQLLSVSIIAFAYIMLYMVWARRTSSPFATFAVIIITIMASCFWFHPRIYIFAYLFTALSILIVTSNDVRLALWLIPLQILWINSHPSAVLGIFIVGVWWLFRSFHEKRVDAFSTCVTLGVVAANVASPMGIHGLVRFIDEVFVNHPSRSNIFEWYSPFSVFSSYSETRSIPHSSKWFFAMCFVAVFSIGMTMVWSSAVRAAGMLMWIAIALWGLAASSARHIPIFYLALASLIICLAEFLGKHHRIPRQLTPLMNNAGFRWVGYGLVVVIIFKTVLFGYANGLLERQFGLGVSQRKFPDRPLGILYQANVGGNIFSDYGSGSYFLYRMFPKYKVYIDGARLDEVYGEEGFERYMQVGNDLEVAKEEIRKYDMRSFVIPLPKSKEDIVPIYRFLSSDPGWRLVYFDDRFLVYVQKEEAVRCGLSWFTHLGPFTPLDKVIKSEPNAATELEKDLQLAQKLELDSLVYLVLRANVLSLMGQKDESFKTIEQIVSFCAEREPTQGCRAIVSQHLRRMGQMKAVERVR